jgi:hypothetical protein
MFSLTKIDHSKIIRQVLSNVFGDSNVFQIGSRAHDLDGIVTRHSQKAEDNDRTYVPFTYFPVVENGDALHTDYDFIVYMPDLEEETKLGHELCDNSSFYRRSGNDCGINYINREKLINYLDLQFLPFTNMVSFSDSSYFGSAKTVHVKFGKYVDIIICFKYDHFCSIIDRHRLIWEWLNKEENYNIVLFSTFLKTFRAVSGKLLFRSWDQMRLISTSNDLYENISDEWEEQKKEEYVKDGEVDLNTGAT